MDREREAAIHFTRYLCATHKISKEVTHIERNELRRIFSEMYQPQFNIQCLEMKTLVPTLAKAGLLEKSPGQGSTTVHFKSNRLDGLTAKNGQYPERPPNWLSKPKQRVIISQRYTLDRSTYLERPGGVSDDKCDICKVPLNPATMEEHIKDELHVLRMRFRIHRKDFDDAKHLLAVRFADPTVNNATTRSHLQFSCRVGIKYEININFSNLLDKSKILLEKILVLVPHKDVKLKAEQDMLLLPGEMYSLEMKAQFSVRGAVVYPIVFKLRVEGTDAVKYHLAEIHLLTQSELMDQLGPSEPYRPSMGPIVKLHNAPLLPGEPAKAVEQELQLVSDLGRIPFDIPPALINFLNHGFKEYPNMSPLQRAKLQEVRAILPSAESRDSLCPENYCQLLELLLFIEEHQMSKDIHYYDMHNTTLKKNHLGLWLRVPGLVDKRPSLLINDTLRINFVEDKSVAYEGYVQKIEGAMVRLGLHDMFVKKYAGQSLEVQFNINRGVLKSMHRALYIISQQRVQHLLFPNRESKPIHQPPLRPWFNKSIEKNPEQQAAVRNIIRNSSEFVPYLVFGPPGTGKTVTLVEAILQLWDPIKKSSRILVCAPSNAAADEITCRLLQVINNTKVVLPENVKNHIFRMCAMSRSFDMMPSIIQNAGVTNHDPTRGLQVRNPRLHVIMSYDIVVTTFSNASKLVLADLPPGHFTHIVMDEVGQALEPEALIPLAGLATLPHTGSFCCQVIMAGDPKQLGPILQSPIAAKFGLDKSILERLMSMPLYSKKPDTNRYDGNVLTKLVLNYRSHPAILKVPNDLFYDGELQPVGDPYVIESACKWKVLKKEGFPVIFHGVEGVDEREGTSPSFFNRQEVEIVLDYIKKLRADKIAVNKEIGVVTPYNMQVKKIKKAFLLEKLPDIDVASVEQFQGQERKVIIISTVRSRPQFLDFDYMFQLGFLRNPKRFNVAVTRARSLLIVVGNPNVLQHDPCWRALLQHCKDNDSYTGIPFQLSCN